jgi:signal transduction histidine kinase
VFTSRALARAAVWLSSTLLTAVAVIVGVLSTFPPPSGGDAELSRALVPIASLAVLGGGTYALQRRHGRAETVIGLLVVGAAAFAYSLSVQPLLTPGQKSDSIVLSLVVVAATVSGVGRRSLAACLLVCGFGYVATASAAVLAADLRGRVIVVDFTGLGSFIAVSLLLIVLWVVRRGAVQEAPALERAAKQQQSIVEEARLLGHASSLLHDTVLGDLQALAMLPPGPIPAGHAALIARDLDLLERSDQLMRRPGTSPVPALIESTSESRLARTLYRVGARGLRVVVSGDAADLSTLDPAAEDALVGAIEQCLVNVIVHADVSLAELAIAVSGDDLTATVADSGRGFVSSSTPADRLGLRLSVHDRMLSVGGSATVWSRPGAGTSVLLTVPRRTS